MNRIRTPREYSTSIAKALSDINTAFKKIKDEEEREAIIHKAAFKYKVKADLLKKIGLFKVVKYYK